MAKSVNRWLFIWDIVSGYPHIIHGRRSLFSYAAKCYSDFMALREISSEHFRPLCELLATLHLVTAEMIWSLEKSQPRLANLSMAENCFFKNLHEIRREYTIFLLNFPGEPTQSRSVSGITTHLGPDMPLMFWLRNSITICRTPTWRHLSMLELKLYTHIVYGSCLCDP